MRTKCVLNPMSGHFTNILSFLIQNFSKRLNSSILSHHPLKHSLMCEVSNANTFFLLQENSLWLYETKSTNSPDSRLGDAVSCTNYLINHDYFSSIETLGNLFLPLTEEGKGMTRQEKFNGFLLPAHTTSKDLRVTSDTWFHS